VGSDRGSPRRSSSRGSANQVIAATVAPASVSTNVPRGAAAAPPATGVAPEQFRARLEQSTLLGRLPTLAELADTAAFVASDGAGALTATVVNLSAGALAE
jgi:NAD(P)-dependent dehydrogenase (short-subunit alcohol dehydrogenase family)